jgi:hypothetical protein
VTSSQRPRDEFVVKLKGRAVEAHSGAKKTTASSGDPRRTWEQLVQDPEIEWAAPVMEGEDGSHHFPTGEVTVRFEHAPTDAQLKAFAEARQLVLKRRNEFAPQQAVFAPLHLGETYLPDLVDDLDKAKGVQTAWANTLSSYRRS